MGIHFYQLIDSIQSSDEFGTEKSWVSPQKSFIRSQIKSKRSYNVTILRHFAKDMSIIETVSSRGF